LFVSLTVAQRFKLKDQEPYGTQKLTPNSVSFPDPKESVFELSPLTDLHSHKGWIRIRIKSLRVRKNVPEALKSCGTLLIGNEVLGSGSGLFNYFKHY
jgi:hypothetical protein